MPRAKKTAHEEVTKKAPVVDEDLVSVEMTEAEKDEFVAFKKDQEKKLKAKSEDLVEVSLRYEHRINGTKYGPGLAQGPLGVITYLKGQDDRHFADRLRENVSAETMIAMNMGGQKTVTRVLTDAIGSNPITKVKDQQA